MAKDPKKKQSTGIEYVVSKDKVDGVVDDQFIALRSEFEQVRHSRTMYVGDSGAKGALHLFKEVFNNALDEMNNDAHASRKTKRVYVSFSEKLQKFTVLDEGRGMPTDVLVDAVMVKHFTTKSVGLSTSRNKKHTGLHGVGLTVTAALSDFMSVTTYRGKHMKRIVIQDGDLKEFPVEKISKDMDGTFGLMVELIPSQKYLGEFHIDNDTVSNFLRNISYIMEKDLEITLVLEDAPKKNKTTIYKYQGLGGAVSHMSSSLEFPPVEVKISNEDYDLTVAFSYDRNYDGTAFASYCNYVITDFGGSHEVLAQQVICQYFTREAKRLEPNSRNEITFDDCKSGLIVAVNLEHIAPDYESQNKERVSNKFGADDKKELYDGIYNVMNNNQGSLKKAIAYLKNVAKARQEAHKIKGVSVKKQTTFLEDAEIPKFFPVTDRNSMKYKEIFLAEGDSAAGAILNCRNAEYQAVLTVNGVTDNVYGLSISRMMEKPTFANLVRVLGCGVGSNFDINKLRYNKIVIACDVDIDGFNIASLLMCFFILFTPELIKQGKIYRAMPPLYLLDEKSLKRISKTKPWVYDKVEYYDLYHSIIADSIEMWIEETPVKVLKSGKIPNHTSPFITPLTKKQIVKWLNINSEYLLELNNFGKKSTTSPILLETLLYLEQIFPDQREFQTVVHKQFPEMNYDPNSCTFSGSWNGEQWTLIYDRILKKAATRYQRELAKNPSIYVWFKYRKDNEVPVRCTIGEFLNLMKNTVGLKIEQRFKGLGEAESDLLFTTAVNPKFRKLHRITIGDFDEALKVFELLHGKGAVLRERRRDLLDNASISYMDIDN